MSNTVSAGFNQRNSHHAVVIGGANVDTTGVATARIIAGESTPGEILKSFGGVGRNIAESLSRLGIRTSFASAIGNDSDGLAMLEHLHAAGVETYSFHPDEDGSGTGRETAGFVSIVTASGHAVAQVADMNLLESTSAAQIRHLAPCIQSASVLVVDANLPEAVLASIFEMNSDAPVIADAVSPSKCQRLSGWLDSISLLKVNEAEAAALTATTPGTKGYSEQLIDQLRHAGPERILLSRGAHGAILLQDQDQFRLASDLNEAINFNGCGDSLLAGVVAAGLSGYPPTVQLRWGQWLAARSSHVHSAVNPAIDITELELLARA